MVTNLSRDVFQIIAQDRGCPEYIVTFGQRTNLSPNILFFPCRGTLVNIPFAKLNKRIGLDETGAFHMPKPNSVMGCKNELRIWKFDLQHFANLSSVSGIHRHENVVQHGEGKAVAKQMLH